MLLSVRIVESVGTKDHFIAIFDDGLACNEDVEPAFVGVVDSKLVAVQLEFAVMAVINEHCRLRDAGLYNTVLEILEEENLGLFDEVYLDIFAVDDLERSSLGTFFAYCYFFRLFILDSGYRRLLSFNVDHFLFKNYLLDTKILSPP